MSLIMSNNKAIEVENLAKTYLDFWRRPAHKALAGITFSVERGDVFALLGPNGSGKSTTIKILLGLVRPTSGRVAILGVEPGDSSARRRIGFLPETTNLHPFLTPRETLRYYAGLFGLDKQTAQIRSSQLLEMVGLSNAANRQIGQFSKGMARRVGIAQALINNPDLIILDEPTSGLDPVGTSAVKKWIGQLASAGKTVFLSSHILADVEDSASRIAILHDGVLRAYGNLHDLVPDASSHKATRLESFFLDAIDVENTPPIAPFLLENP